MRSTIASRILAAASVACIASACASTSVSTLAAPELAGRRIRSILVVAGFEDIGLRRRTEDQFLTHEGPGVRYIPSHRVFFPGRSYSGEEISTALANHRIEATLVIRPRAAGEEVTYVAPSYVTSCSGGWTPQSGCSEVTTTPTSPGASIRKPWLSTSVMMFDANTAQSVWVASGFTGGNAFANSNTLLESVVDRIHASLASDQVTDPKGCLLPDRDQLIAAYRRQVALEAEGNRYRYLVSMPNQPYTIRESRARTDSINADLEATRREAREQLLRLPSPEEIQNAKNAIADLSDCSNSSTDYR